MRELKLVRAVVPFEPDEWRVAPEVTQRAFDLRQITRQQAWYLRDPARKK